MVPIFISKHGFASAYPRSIYIYIINIYNVYICIYIFILYYIIYIESNGKFHREPRRANTFLDFGAFQKRTAEGCGTNWSY